MGVRKQGIDFQSLDGKPSCIFILTLSPLEGSAPHLQFMATISRTLDEEKRTRLLACRSDKDLYGILSD